MTLYVGKERVKYQAHKDMLCELLFFQKALQGPFEEASKNEINMPDDNPAALSALIENLYTGHYKYDPNVPVREFQGLSGPEPPSVELAKPLFHLEVLVLADKYEDRRLEREAMYLFADSISVLDTLDKLRLWKAAYATGAISYGYYGSGSKETVKWLKKLYEEHPEAVLPIISDFPGLANDLLYTIVAEH